MQKLTEAFIASLTPDGHDRMVFDSSMPGFGIRITASGRKLFIARARAGGKRRYIALGDCSAMKLVDARRAAGEALAALRDGRDPVAERAARVRAQKAGETTLAALAERWMAEVVTPKRKPRTREDYRRIIDQKIGPSLGHLVVSQIGRDDVIRWHAGMAKTPRRANYSLATLKALLNFAEDVGLRPPHTNPARRIEMFREGVRERFLSEAEIARAADGIARAEADGRIGPHAAAGLRLALFTGARSGEITAAKWEHLDRAQKVIRLPDSKTNTPRDIHLNSAAMDVLTSIPRVGPYIIAGADEGEPLKNLRRSWAVARKYVGLENCRLHDLRHSFASLAVNKGISLPIIGKLLGHRVPATTQRYAHLARGVVSDVNAALGEAMVAAIEIGAKSSNVVKLKTRRRRRG